MRIKNELADVNKKEVWNRDWQGVKDIYFWRLRQHYFGVAPLLRGKVLDLGCGPGYLAAWTEPNESFYTGVDISETAIGYGKELFPAATFLVHDLAVDTLPFENNSFETVVMSEVIEHLPDYSHLLQEAKRVSSKYILISVPVNMPNPDHVWPEWSEEDIKREFSILGNIKLIKTDTIYNFNVVWIEKN